MWPAFLAARQPEGEHNLEVFPFPSPSGSHPCISRPRKAHTLHRLINVVTRVKSHFLVTSATSALLNEAMSAPTRSPICMPSHLPAC